MDKPEFPPIEIEKGIFDLDKWWYDLWHGSLRYDWLQRLEDRTMWFFGQKTCLGVSGPTGVQKFWYRFNQERKRRKDTIWEDYTDKIALEQEYAGGTPSIHKGSVIWAKNTSKKTIPKGGLVSGCTVCGEYFSNWTGEGHVCDPTTEQILDNLKRYGTNLFAASQGIQQGWHCVGCGASGKIGEEHECFPIHSLGSSKPIGHVVNGKTVMRPPTPPENETLRQ